MFMPLHKILQTVVRTGNLAAAGASGSFDRFGDGTGDPVRIRFADRATEMAVALDPQLALGEAYMQGRLTVEQGGIYDFLALVMRNLGPGPLPRWAASLDHVRYLTRRVRQFNPARRSRRNVAHHYDIDGAIYDLFLDGDRQYSCGYFTPGADLDEAQRAKCRHVAAKLAIEPGHRVLDIGSGWGGLALYLAKATGAEVTGVTLSTEQLRLAEARVRRQGLARRVRFALQDYRKVSGVFDRIVSVGMFEHVGVNHYATYFGKIRELLTDGGVALVHTIGRSDPPGATNPFIAKYIFPGGYLPALSEMTAAIERSGLIVSDIEILRLHYAETLRAWRERFAARRADAVALKGEPFARMWEFYLASSECAFRYQNLVVFQVQLVRRVDALSIRRDYMQETERRLARQEKQPAREPGRDAAE